MMDQIGPELEESSLSPKQLRVISLLMQGLPHDEVADRAGSSRSSIKRWLKQDAFRSALTQAKSEAWAASSAALTAHAGIAAKTLADTMKDDDAPASVKVRAAEIVISFVQKAFESDLLESRLSVLEGISRDNP